MTTLTPKLLEELKRIKLPGEIPLTHKPVLPSILLFSERPKDFLHALRELRQTLSFRAGPSKKRKTASRDEGDLEGEGEQSSGEEGLAKGSRTKKKNKNLRERVAGSTNLSEGEKDLFLSLLSTPKTRSKKK